MGIVFEMPMVMSFFGKMGLINRGFLRKYRRHAKVIIPVVAAIITPTSNVFTLLVVSLPMYLLYEAGIRFVPRRPASGEPEKD